MEADNTLRIERTGEETPVRVSIIEQEQGHLMRIVLVVR
jgi:hypothetical protein